DAGRMDGHLARAGNVQALRRGSSAAWAGDRHAAAGEGRRFQGWCLSDARLDRRSVAAVELHRGLCEGICRAARLDGAAMTTTLTLAAILLALALAATYIRLLMVSE